MNFTRPTRRFGAVALGTAIAGGITAATLAANPAGAAGIVSVVTTVSCSVTGANWCISGNDSSSGIGVIGTSKSGTGLRGTSTSQYGLKATSGSGTAILAQTASGNSAITAIGSSSGYGVVASGAGVGVYGATTSGRGDGIYGVSLSSGTGVFGYSETGYGVYGSSFTGTAGYFVTGADTANTGNAISAKSHGGTAVYAINTNGYGADIQGSNIGIVGRAPTSGYPLALNRSDGNLRASLMWMAMVTSSIRRH